MQKGPSQKERVCEYRWACVPELAKIMFMFMLFHVCLWNTVCCYFRGINFSRLAAQKHIRGLLNSHWADAHLSFLYCKKSTSFNEWYIYKYLTGQHKNKAGLRQTRVYYPFASTHIVKTQLLHVQNIANIFAGFWIRASWILREIREN